MYWNMKIRTRSIGRPLFPLLLLILLLGITRGHAWAGLERTASLDTPSCDATVQPGDSIQTAINNSANGQTICVRGGVYHELIKVPPTRTGLTLVAVSGETPIIDGGKLLPGGLPEHRFMSMVQLQGEGTVFDGFEVRYSSARGLDVAGNNITVRNTSVHDNWSTGINVRGGATLSGVLIENNRVYNNLRRAQFAPVIYRGLRSGGGPADWTFDPDANWDSPFWSGAEADLPEQWLNGVSMTFNDDGQTSRVYAGSVRSARVGYIGADHSANGQQFSYSGADILFHAPAANKWTLYFDGDTLGLPATGVIDAFQIEGTLTETLPCPSCSPIVMSFAAPLTLPISDGTTVTPTQIEPSDLVRFSPTTVGSLDQITGGGFTLYKRADDLGLPAGTNIDSLDRAPDGRLLMSFVGGLTLGSLTVKDEDLVAYDESTVSWVTYFDGDLIPYNPFSDDLNAAWLDRNGHIYISGDPVGGSALALIDTQDSTARGNHVYNNYGEGLVADRYSSRITLEDNVAYDNQHANLYLNSTANPLVRGNLVYCTDDQRFWRKGSAVSYRPGPGIQIRDESFDGTLPPVSTGQIIINNIVIGCSTNFGVSTQTPGGGLNNALVANNTFADARAETAAGANNIELNNDAAYVNSRFVNNLILQNAPGTVVRAQGLSNVATFTVANNLYSVTPPSSWFPGEPGRVVGNPQLADPTPPLPVAGNMPDPNDYRLTYGSPAFDAGQALAEVDADFFDQSRIGAGALDVGAYELPYKGTIIVEHTVQPSGQEFDFSAGYVPGGFRLGDGGRHESGLLDAGVYNVSVAPVQGWTTTGTCNDGSPAEAVYLAPGETVTCAFSSVRETRLVVANAVTPASDPQLFNFALAPGESFQLGNGSRTFAVPPSAPHALTVSVPGGWRQTSATCDNGASPGAITLNPGDWVTCTFAHEKLGRIVIRKETTPEGTGQRFNFTAGYDADGFVLGDGESDTSNYLPAGTYAVSEALPPGWTQTNAVCDDGSAPGAIALGAGETVTCTFTNSRTITGPLATIYVATPSAGTVRGLSYAAGDVLAYDGRVDAWSLYFDASDVGITKSLSDFVLMPDGSLLLTFNSSMKLRNAAGALFTLDMQDVARFIPTRLGATTAGVFEMYFDGSDVGLSTSGEKIDALARKTDGTLLISTTDSASVKNGSATINAQDEDLLAFVPQTLGASTKGVWSLAFDGSVLTGMAAEDVTTVWHSNATGNLYLTITNNFTVGGVSGTNRTVLAVTPARAVSAYWDAANAGFPGSVDGLHITPAP
jgi:hypothetical protein